MADVEAGREVPEIRALGPLVRITDIMLWDDIGVITSGASTHSGFLSLEPAASSLFQNSCITADELNTNHTISGRVHFCGRAGVGSTDGCLGASTLLWHEQSDEENDCEDLNEQKEKQQGGMFSSYYGHDRLIPTISEDENAFSFPETCTSSSLDLDTAHENVALNKKLRARKPQSQKMQKLARCLSSNLFKYWCQRYSLFSRFDNGIKMDEESWFSVTPELIAKHHAFRCGSGTIIDCFTGVGGNAIQFAMRSNHVIAIDVDPQKIDYAHHNAVIYEVSERIDFIKGDFFKVAPSLKAEVVFLSPPWGGPDYSKMPTYDIRSLKPHEGYQLFKIASLIAAKVVMFLPRNVNLDQLMDLSQSVYPPWKLEIEKNYLNGKLKAITAYFDNTSPE